MSEWLLPVGLMFAVWLFFRGVRMRRGRPGINSGAPTIPRFTITISPLLIGGFVCVLTLFGPVLEVARRWLGGEAFDGHLLAGSLMMGAVTGGVIYAVISIGIWLISKSKKKDPSQHF